MVLFLELHRPRMTLDMSWGEGWMIRLLSSSFVSLRVMVHDVNGNAVQVR